MSFHCLQYKAVDDLSLFPIFSEKMAIIQFHTEQQWHCFVCSGERGAIISQPGSQKINEEVSLNVMV